VFDPEKVADPATYNDPHHYAVGIPHVLVNGVQVIKKRRAHRREAGTGLRHQAGARS